MAQQSAGSRSLVALARIGARLGERERAIARQHGLTAPQVRALRLLHAGECASAAALARAMGLKPPTVTGIVDRLVRNGLVTRERGGPDRRKVALVLTSEGHRRVGALPLSEVDALGPQIDNALDAATLLALLAQMEELLTSRA